MAVGEHGIQKQRLKDGGEIYYPIKVHVSDAQPSI